MYEKFFLVWSSNMIIQMFRKYSLDHPGIRKILIVVTVFQLKPMAFKKYVWRYYWLKIGQTIWLYRNKSIFFAYFLDPPNFYKKINFILLQSVLIHFLLGMTIIKHLIQCYFPKQEFPKIAGISLIFFKKNCWKPLIMHNFLKLLLSKKCKK